LDDVATSPASDVAALLQGERAPCTAFLAVALAYLRSGVPDGFETVASAGAAAAPRNDRELARLDRAELRAVVGLHNSLAAFFISRASSAPSGAGRDPLVRRAIEAINAAERAGGASGNPDEATWATWVNRGWLMLAQGDADRASQQFGFVLTLDPAHPAALAGAACVRFRRAEYKEAMALFRQALGSGCPAPSIRYGIAMCAAKLGLPDLCERALVRAVGSAHAAAANVEALAALAVVNFNRGAIRSAMEKLDIAFRGRKAQHPVVLNHLANHYFYRGERERALSLAAMARDATDDEHCRAESLYLIARAHHALGQLDQAIAQYSMAVVSWPEFPLAQYGLGQMHLHKGELDKAAACFEKVLAAVPDNYETLCALGAIYTHLGRREQALQHVRAACRLAPEGDAQPWLDMAQLTDPLNERDAALSCYEKAVGTLVAAHESIAPEVWNNMGVLQMQAGRLADAEKSLLAAVRASGSKVEEYSASCITYIFNLARLHEIAGRGAQAEELYKGIILEHPNYVDCFIRLGVMAKEKGVFGPAAEMFKEVFSVNKDHADTWSLLALLHLEQEEWLPAQRKLETVLKLTGHHDAYALVGLGNLYYLAKFEKRDKADRYLSEACRLYLEAIKQGPANIYAANGLGIVLAEHGEVALARDAF
jgi:RNA polymerase-associated protein CTR9